MDDSFECISYPTIERLLLVFVQHERMDEHFENVFWQGVLGLAWLRRKEPPKENARGVLESKAHVHDGEPRE